MDSDGGRLRIAADLRDFFLRSPGTDERDYRDGDRARDLTESLDFREAASEVVDDDGYASGPPLWRRAEP